MNPDELADKPEPSIARQNRQWIAFAQRVILWNGVNANLFCPTEQAAQLNVLKPQWPTP